MGWITYPHHPRFGGNYRGLTNRLDLLLETYSYISFAERVRVTYGFLRESLRYVAEQGAEILSLLNDSVTPPSRVAVGYRLEAFEEPKATILTREPYTLSGNPIEVQVPHFARFVGERFAQRPLAYAVPAQVADHLALHGLKLAAERGTPRLDAEIPVIRQRIVEGGREILEAATFAHLEVETMRQARPLPSGWRLVYTAQQRGAIAVYLCEASSDDGLVACGIIDAPDVGAEFPAWRVHGVAG
jgi:hypothetical protein